MLSNPLWIKQNSTIMYTANYISSKEMQPDIVAQKKKYNNRSKTFEYKDNRNELVAQRKINNIISQGKKNTQQVTQLKVDKYRAGAWYSTYDPYSVFATKKEATDYDRDLRKQGREPLRPRVPTLYTYTHTKPTNKLGFTLQGPHTVAHRVILQALINAEDADDVYDIFDSQVDTPDTIKDFIGIDELPDSGSFSKQIQDRLDRYLADYESVYDQFLDEYNDASPDLINLKHLANQLLNMDPYAVYAWKTTVKASAKSLGGKGESVRDPTFDDMYDTPPANSFKDKGNLKTFVDARHQLFDDNF